MKRGIFTICGSLHRSRLVQCGYLSPFLGLLDADGEVEGGVCERAEVVVLVQLLAGNHILQSIRAYFSDNKEITYHGLYAYDA